MVGSKTHHHASSSLLPEELNLLQKARCSPDDGNGVVHNNNGGGGGRGALGQWKCRLLDSLRPRRPRCVVCLQVQHVTGMPPAAEGRGVVVGWRSKGGEGEHTAPARVSRGGAAAFDEVFLHYFTAGGSTLRSFTVWAVLVDEDSAPGGGDIGAFPVDLAEAAAAESSHPQFGGKALSFPLGGAAAGAVLTVSVYCRVMEQEEIHGANGNARERKNKGKSASYASCLPDLSCLRTRPSAAGAATGAPRRATSLRSERGGFITIENSVAEMEEEEGFITMEKGTVSSRSRRAALALEALAAEEEAEDEKPCLFMELSSSSGEASALEVEGVEEEFLAMLEDKYWAEMARSKEIEKGLSVSLDAGLDLGLDLDTLIRDAETELARAEQAWRSKVGAAIVEEEEYKELLRRWGSGAARDRDREHLATSNSGCSWGFGFGSPI
ncbi:hypothetical protein CFC21_085331 [Triticum aestivum]|uniref:C2 NT-type domain-containing protein n=3 Tax=Triticum TaxID=4564 RepID=A0A9R1ICY2_WHEAT|nr:uncharacterized protein LOC125515457 [Triticum urartu]KAF7003742.1 hypothetical protein CFC21_019027 [Triticum aestivum]KAF7081381.1 hypothetical protein CFC21_085329 [Triticum aestivum]KAF7081383.1 hypothetical protein CFC21_085331 [Triticum aestivum]